MRSPTLTLPAAAPPAAWARAAAHIGTAGFCVGSRLKRFFSVTRSCGGNGRRGVSRGCKRRGGGDVRRTRENLSSGEKRAGCADCVALPSGAVFCAAAARSAERQRSANNRRAARDSRAARALSVYTTLPASSMYIMRYMAPATAPGSAPGVRCVPPAAPHAPPPGAVKALKLRRS